MSHSAPQPPILSIRDLHVSIHGRTDARPILKGLSVDIPRGSTVALLGESGSGKTLAAYAVLNVLPRVARLDSGQILFNGADLRTMPPAGLNRVRGNRIGMVYQEPSTSLNPLLRVGDQISETLTTHKGLSHRNAREQVISLMELVGIPDARRRYSQLPHQFSGGVKQRLVIAMALACHPELLLADEPTSALDSTVQAQILDLLSRLITDLRMSVFLISHDLGVIAALADRVAVLLDGMVVEDGAVRDVLEEPAHPYTRALLSGKPRPSGTAVEESLPASSPGCPFLRNCPHRLPVCSRAMPDPFIPKEGRMVRCFLFGEPPGDAHE